MNVTNIVKLILGLSCVMLSSTAVKADTVMMIGYPDPGITLKVDVTTGDAWLIGNPGAITSQYTITSASGSIITGNLNTVESQYINNVPGLSNYILWMDMSGPTSEGVERIWDKCCPAADPTSEGRIYFDNLTDRTLYIGRIFEVGGEYDLIFAYAYGYTTDEYGWQLIGYETYPDPGIDGVSAFGNILYVPEPASLTLLASGLILAKKRVRKSPPASRAFTGV